MAKKLNKKLRQIEQIKKKADEGAELDAAQRAKLSGKFRDKILD